MKNVNYIYTIREYMVMKKVFQDRVIAKTPVAHEDSDTYRYTMEVGDVSVRVSQLLERTKGTFPQAHLVRNLTRDNYNSTLENPIVDEK